MTADEGAGGVLTHNRPATTPAQGIAKHNERVRASRPMVTRSCMKCGSDFTVANKAGNGRLRCYECAPTIESLLLAARRHRSRAPLTTGRLRCLLCGSRFDAPVRKGVAPAFCSTECREARKRMQMREYAARRSAARQRTVVCENPECATTVTTGDTRVRYCSDACRDRHFHAVHGWRVNSPEKMKAIYMRRRARKVKIGGSSTPEQIAGRVAMFGGKCWMCGGPYEHLDHVIPVVRGGSDWPANLRPACARCNLSKNDRMPSFLPDRPYIDAGVAAYHEERAAQKAERAERQRTASESSKARRAAAKQQRRDDMLALLRDLGAKLGKTPSTNDLERIGFSPSRLHAEFGSLREAQRLAGFEPNAPTPAKWTDQQIVETFRQCGSVGRVVRSLSGRDAHDHRYLQERVSKVVRAAGYTLPNSPRFVAPIDAEKAVAA